MLNARTVGLIRYKMLFAASLAAGCSFTFAQISYSQNANNENLTQFDLGFMSTATTAPVPMPNTQVEAYPNNYTYPGNTTYAGNYGPANHTVYNNYQYVPPAARTNTQGAARLLTRTAQLDKVYGGGLGNLPPTRLDSFVKNAGGNAETIYGDEGTESIPPLFDFDSINSGITSSGLTTGQQ